MRILTQSVQPRGRPSRFTRTTSKSKTGHAKAAAKLGRNTREYRPKPHAITIVLNPNARKPKLSAPSLENLKAMLGPNACIHLTRNLDELDQLMREWKKEEETVCFYGGDGSIGRGLTSLIRHQGETSNLPPVLVVRAGTINMLNTIVGFREDVDRTLTRWKDNELHFIREIPTIKVEVEGQKLPHYGFVFAWGVGYRVLNQYYGRRPVPDVTDAVAAMSQAFSQAVVQGLLPGLNNIPIFRKEDVKLRVNGKPIGGRQSHLHTLTVGTIARLSLGIRPFPPVPITAGGFHFSANGMALLNVVRHSATLLFGMGDLRRIQDESLINGAQTEELTCALSEGFTLDGEMFPLERPSEVRVSPGPVIRFWTNPAEATPE